MVDQSTQGDTERKGIRHVLRTLHDTFSLGYKSKSKSKDPALATPVKQPEVGSVASIPEATQTTSSEAGIIARNEEPEPPAITTQDVTLANVLETMPPPTVSGSATAMTTAAAIPNVNSEGGAGIADTGQLVATTTAASNATANTSPPPIPKTVGELMWEKVYAGLKEDELKVYKELNLEFPVTGDVITVLDQVQNEAENQKTACDGQETHKILGHEVNFRQWAEKALKWTSKVMDIGDILAGLNPHASIPWSVFKFLVKAGTADFDERTLVVAGIGVSLEMINRIHVYMQFLEHVPKDTKDTKMRDNYEASMLSLMKKLVQFLIRAIHVESERGTGIRFFKALWAIDKVQGFEAECREYIRTIEDNAQACHRELSFQNGVEVQKQLNDIMVEIGNINLLKNQLDLIGLDIEKIWGTMNKERKGIILKWISKVSPTTFEPTPGTCEWILEDTNFIAWNALGVSRFFWLQGQRKSPNTRLFCL
jgi:hypothetical protein